MSPRKPSSRRSDSAKSSGPKRSGQSQDTKRPQQKAGDVTLASLLSESLRCGTFLKLVLSQPVAKSSPEISKVTVRPIDIGGKVKFQWTIRSNSQELHDNLSTEELIAKTNATFGTSLSDAHLFTIEADITVRWNYGGPQRLKRKAPSLVERPTEGHNRQKQYLIPAGTPCPFLIEIGVMAPNGQVRPSMYHKFRQINRYLEFVEDVIPHLPPIGPIHVVDFGCGKSYLTFALHHLFTAIHQRKVLITGLDVKQDVIDDCSRIARKLNCDGLSFQMGRIENFTPSSHVHLAVSLHACDTATDDALAAALRWQCEVILAVPCCQHEICQSLGKPTLPGLTEYGLLKERFASLATDALRAQFLELHGYKTQVLEFIETEHTPKNVLLRAVRRHEDEVAEVTSRRHDYDQLKQLLGLKNWHLEDVVEPNKSTQRPEVV